MSFFLAKALNGRKKTSSKEKSFPHAVNVETSVDRLIAGRISIQNHKSTIKD